MLRELQHAGGGRRPFLVDRSPQVVALYTEVEIVHIQSVSRVLENLYRTRECPF